MREDEEARDRRGGGRGGRGAFSINEIGDSTCGGKAHRRNSLRQAARGAQTARQKSLSFWSDGAKKLSTK